MAAMRSPTTFPISPPTFASTSSKTSTGTESRSASTALSASMTRASSPLEAIRLSGIGASPTLGEKRNSQPQSPVGPRPGCWVIETWNCALPNPRPAIAADAALARLRAAFSRWARSSAAAFLASRAAASIWRPRRSSAPSVSPWDATRRRIASRASSIVFSAISRAFAEPASRMSHTFLGLLSYFARRSCIGASTRITLSAAQPLH